MVAQIERARSRTDLAASPAGRSFFGEPVTLRADVGRAKVGSGTPGGSVRFDLNGEPVGTPVPLRCD